MSRFLAALALVLWGVGCYLASLFGMIAGPGMLAWHWFSAGLPAWLAAILTLLAATLPLMIGAWAMNAGGVWASRPVWRLWTFGWAAIGGALFLSMVTG